MISSKTLAAAVTFWVLAWPARFETPATPSVWGTQGESKLTGKVVEGVSPLTVPDAVVEVVSRDGLLRRSTRSHSGGEFSFANLPPGTYSVTASKAGYSYGSFGQRQFAGASRTIVLDAGSSLSISVPIWRHGSITGRVGDTSGRPLVNKTVQILTRVSIAGHVYYAVSAIRARTDDRGLYSAAVPPGTYVLGVTARPTGIVGAPVHASSFYPDAETPMTAAQFQIEPGQERFGADFVLREVPTHAVSGRVLDPGGATVAGLTVRLVLIDESLSDEIEIASTVLGEGGTFVFPAVPPGPYEIRTQDGVVGGANTSGPARNAATETRALQPTRYASQPVVAGSASQEPVVLTLKRAARIRGRLAFVGTAPHPTAEIVKSLLLYCGLANGRSTRTGGPVTVDESGRFSTNPLPAGTYTITPLPGNTPDGWVVSSVTVNGTPITNESVVLDDSDIEGVVVSFVDKIAEVSGLVSSATGQADAAATVFAFPLDRRLWTDFGRYPIRLRKVRVGPDGRYSITGLPPGAYYVASVSDRIAPEWNTESLEVLSRLAKQIRIAAGETVSVDLKSAERNPE